jgi:hypothetical protein
MKYLSACFHANLVVPHLSYYSKNCGLKWAAQYEEVVKRIFDAVRSVVKWACFASAERAARRVALFSATLGL